MELISDIDHATAVAGSVCAGVAALRDAEFWKLGDKELLTLAETLERVGRLVYAAQVHHGGPSPSTANSIDVGTAPASADFSPRQR